MQTGDAGLAWAEPVVEVRKPDGQHVLYGHVTADKAAAFAKAAAAGIAKEHAIGVISGAATDGVPMLADIDWAKIQVRWLMHNCGVIDPDNIDHYIARGGYSQYMAAAQMDRDALINVVKGSTLRGHSGSFFSTGMKWSFLKDAKAEPKYLVCNADEGDPGAWVNRVVMESDPHSILEGLLIGAYATGATHGWIYIRDEYPLAVERVNRALQACRDRGIYGENALGTGVRFDAEVVRGAGAYVCGDETGLISSVNDERGMPRIKPPFPAQSGVLGKPTNVNNVETYASVTTLLRVTPETFSTVGTEVNRGTKMFTVSGACEKTGCMEVPFGAKVSDVLAAAGGIANGREFKALQQGGPLSGLLPARIAADLPLEPEPFRPLGAGMGGGGLIFVDDTSCVVNMNIMFADFLEDESCARCTTCRGGNQRMVEILERVARGEAQPDDPERIKSLGASMQFSNCFHGTLSPTIINNTMQYFREEYDAHAVEHRCPAQVVRRADPLPRGEPVRGGGGGRGDLPDEGDRAERRRVGHRRRRLHPLQRLPRGGVRGHRRRRQVPRRRAAAGHRARRRRARGRLAPHINLARCSRAARARLYTIDVKRLPMMSRVTADIRGRGHRLAAGPLHGGRNDGAAI